jgi:hypothetical protein
MNRNHCWLLLVLLAAWPQWSSAQGRLPSMQAAATPAAKPGWDTSLAGKWTYRSYLNLADVIVGDDPEPAVKNLAAIFGQGSTANNAAKGAGSPVRGRRHDL